MSAEDETRRQVEEDAQEDLELKDEAAEDVAGGFSLIKVKDE
ncbi:MAG: hypothetical protein ACRDL2_01290 [Gaiellaceae bacterium]